MRSLSLTKFTLRKLEGGLCAKLYYEGVHDSVVYNSKKKYPKGL